MAEAKKKCRQYNVEYLRYGFIPSPSNPQQPFCLISLKISKTPENDARRQGQYFQSVRDNFQKRPKLPGIFSSASRRNTDGLRASYNISLLIAKCGKPHAIGEELTLPAVSEVLRTVVRMPATEIIKRIPLSNNTVQRRIDEMSADVENTLCNILRTEEFPLQVDESTTKRSAYVRFIKEVKLVQELLFASELLTDTRGESIFRTVEDFFKEKEIPLTNVIAVATDGAPSMLGRHRGFLSYLKEKVPDLLAVHCVIHRQHLVAKRLSDRLHRSLQYVITAVNKIKSSALRERLFSQLCEENDEDFNRLLLHTEVRWLSKGACLSRFYALFDTVVQFLETEDTELRHNVEKSRADIAYMSDLYFKFNEMNLQLQGDQLNLIKTKTVVTAFIDKLAIFGQNLGRGEYRQFPNLNDLKENGGLPDDVVRSFCDHLSMLHEDMCERYKDILSMMIPDWVLDPFTSLAGVEVAYQEELIEMQANEELKPKIKGGYTSFWLQQEIRQLYPRLWNVAKKFLIPFPSSYLVERGFSAIVRRGDTPELLTTIEPDVDKLVALHQAQSSH
ncbi:hypothetical protein M514_08497 [Trichuris suis]|uniref:DUF4371 domain-containing protein n=1 Tax=Trichuris suis TaxID=68888 RepID=A0A085N210_9BILA|nr:hypothetical protein M514_08497 [Trichuris suis]